MVTLDVFLEQLRRACGGGETVPEFVGALRVELTSVYTGAVNVPAIGVPSCDARAGKLTMSLGDPMSRREFSLDVSDVPAAARPRTLALAVAEMLRLPVEPAPTAEVSLPAAELPASHSTPASSRVESVGESHAVRLDDRDAIPSAEAPHGRSSPRWQLPVLARATVIGPRHTLALGIAAGASLVLSGKIRSTLALEYSTAGEDSTLGSVRLHAWGLSGACDVTLWTPNAFARLEAGAGATLYRFNINAHSVWGVDEPGAEGVLALWDIHTQFSAALDEDLRLFTRLGVVKDIVGARLRAGGEEVISLYGLGAELGVGAAYLFR